METRKTPLDLATPQASKAMSYRFETNTYMPAEGWSIFDESVRYRLAGLYRDVAKCGVDGILIQDDLIMYQNEDFSPKARARFFEDTGKRLDPKALYGEAFQDAEGHWCVPRYSETFWQWASWKNQQLLRLARRLIVAARSVNPEISIAMNFMYESVTSPRHALAWLSQSLHEATKLPIDYFAIMAYHRQIQKELRLSEVAAYEKVAHMTSRLLEWIEDPHKILMKVQMADWKTRKEIPPYEANQVFRKIRQRGRVSLAFIPYSPTLPLNVIGHHYR
jgi:biofilm PGA synthesis lipoprotein PgaB